MTDDELVTDEQIREWDRLIRAGGTIAPGAGYKLSVCLAVIRRVNGMGIDHSDAYGATARGQVDRVLDASD